MFFHLVLLFVLNYGRCDRKKLLVNIRPRFYRQISIYERFFHHQVVVRLVAVMLLLIACLVLLHDQAVVIQVLEYDILPGGIFK